MSLAQSYSAKAPIIIEYTLTLADTWYAINTAVRGVRRWVLKSRESTYNAFDYDYTATHTTYMTNGGIGISRDNCDLPVVYARSSTAGTILELEYWG